MSPAAGRECLSITHVPFEGPGLIAAILREGGRKIRILQAGVDDLAAADPLAPALLVVLGGPIGANDEADYPFLADEVRLIERRLVGGRPTLGICLGAQLIARALGARVYAAEKKEIGWTPLALTPEGERSCLRHAGPEKTAVLHWHGDNFDLPADAVRLASTEACPNQAFAWGRACLALQFHLEVTAAQLEQWLIGHAVEIAATGGIDVAALRRQTARHAPACEAQGRVVFEEWLAAAGVV